MPIMQGTQLNLEKHDLEIMGPGNSQPTTWGFLSNSSTGDFMQKV